MKKLLLVLCIASGLFACAKKEELAPDLTTTEKLVIPLTSFQRLQDSPTCVIPSQNLLTIATARSLFNDYGVYGNSLDFSSSAWSTSIGSSENYIRLHDYSGYGNIVISFGEWNYPETGIYYTNTSGYNSDYDHKRYVHVYLETHDPWNNSFPKAEVKTDQRVLVVVDQNKEEARIKFCDAELVLKNGNTGTITGEIVVDID